MKIKITNNIEKKIILKAAIDNENINIMIEPTDTYEIDGAHNVHISASKDYIKIYYQSRYERTRFSYINIPYDELIDIKIER